MLTVTLAVIVKPTEFHRKFCQILLVSLHYSMVFCTKIVKILQLTVVSPFIRKLYAVRLSRSWFYLKLF